MTAGPGGPERSGAGFDDLVGRLASGAAPVRRLAVLDLVRLAGTETEPAREVDLARRVAGVLTDYLRRETDERALIGVARFLARAHHGPALEALWALYADRATPARAAHAAIIAHDTITGGARAPA